MKLGWQGVRSGSARFAAEEQASHLRIGSSLCCQPLIDNDDLLDRDINLRSAGNGERLKAVSDHRLEFIVPPCISNPQSQRNGYRPRGKNCQDQLSPQSEP